MKKIIAQKSKGDIAIQAIVTNQGTTLKLTGWNGQDYVPLVDIFPEMDSDYVNNEVSKFQYIHSTARYKQNESISVLCYSDPQIERAYQSMRQLWIMISKATDLGPRAEVCKNKLEELGFK